MQKKSETKATIANETRKPFIYVAIGASAGGLEALELFFKNLPSKTGLTFFLIQHLSPDYKSIMPELISKWNNLSVFRVENNMPVKPDSVYLIPPKKHMTIFHKHLYLDDFEENGLNFPIDTFFKSLAVDQGKNSIAIILSGAGSDGASGIKAIKERGGMVIVQDPKTTKFDSMPNSAISTGLVEYILSPNLIPEYLIRYTTHPYSILNPNKQKSSETSDYNKILSLIRSEIGLDFINYKPSTIFRRIERRIAIKRINSLQEYYKEISADFSELENLYKDLLIGVTSFFRDTEAWNVLRHKVLPDLFSKYRNAGGTIRIWIPGCSTGEEAYSLAIACQEEAEKQDYHDYKIFATDLDQESLEKATFGIFRGGIVSEIENYFLNKYFKSLKDGGYQVKDIIRKRIVFAPHNVISDPPFSRIDFISCRNLLIYIQPEIQDKILNMFLYSLNQDGYLFLGTSESLSKYSEHFEIIDNKWKIFKYNNYTAKVAPLEINNQRNTKIDISNRKFAKDVKKNNQAAPDFVISKIVNEYLFSGILINQSHQIVHTFGMIEQYLSFPRGAVSYSLMDVINKSLYSIISSLLFKANKEGKEAKIANHRYVPKKGSDETIITIHVKPVAKDNKINQEYYLIVIQEIEDLPFNLSQKKISNLDSDLKDRIMALERELGYKEESLQTTIEELETSNEELQASNEELVSSNEELQSTNEELQSVNEELHTVNAEHQKKIEELSILNNDIQNLLENTTIGSLYLDSNLNIRRFTGGMSKILNILNVDIDRPVSHVSAKTPEIDIEADAAKVVENLQPIKREIYFEEDWFEILIKPYREINNSINGVIIILQRITEVKRLISEVANRSQMKRTLIDNVPGFDFYYFDNNMKILLAGGENFRRLGYTKFDFEGKYPEEIYKKETLAKIKALYKNALAGNKSQAIIKSHDEKLEVRCLPVKNDEGEIIAGMAMVRSMRKDNETKIRIKKALENTTNIFTDNNISFIELSANNEIVNYNFTNKEILGLKRVTKTKLKNLLTHIKVGEEMVDSQGLLHLLKLNRQKPPMHALLKIQNKDYKLILYPSYLDEELYACIVTLDT